ncbi:MAG: sodium/solute symporter [Planctomycetia bacterium]|jgi:SSS family solute:Na+ symporter
MDKIALEPLDIGLIVLYLLGVTAIGLWMSRGIKSSKDFFLAGRSLPWWAVGMSLVVSDIGAKDMIGLAADGYQKGMVMMNYDFIGCIFSLLIAAFLFMPFFWMAGVYTIPEYLGRRYNIQVRVMFALAWTCFMVGTLGTIFVSSAVMFEILLGWNFWFSVILTAVLVGLYTTIGGLKAVVITDTISCFILIVGAALICGLGLYEAGGVGGMLTEIDKVSWASEHTHLILPKGSPDHSWPAVILGLGFVLGPAYWIGNQAIVQRTLGTKSQNAARASYLCCAGIKMIFPFLLVIPGLIAVALFRDQLGVPGAEGWNANRVLPTLVINLLPTGVLGIVMGAFLAGVLSNLDSYINSASTLIVTDIYKPFVSRHADRHYLAVGRWLVVIFLVFGVVMSYVVHKYFGSVFEAFQTFASFFQGPLLVLLLLGMLTRFATAWGGFCGMLVGVVSAVTMKMGFNIHYLWVAWWSFVIAFVCTVLVSSVTRRYSDERLKGLVCWLPSDKEMMEDDSIEPEAIS